MTPITTTTHGPPWTSSTATNSRRDPTDLTLAQDTFNFIVGGWDTSQTDGCPGGVFWEDVAGSQRIRRRMPEAPRLAWSLTRADQGLRGPVVGHQDVRVGRQVPLLTERSLL